MSHFSLKPMLPSLVTSLPEGKDWMYEIKYDGYRCLLYCSVDEVRLTSRNGMELGLAFPEVKQYIGELLSLWTYNLPCMLDGELCVLLHDKKADFEAIQARGRLKDTKHIELKSKQTPASFLAFDCLMKNGEWMTKMQLKDRKKCLTALLSHESGMENILPGRPLNKIIEHHDLNRLQTIVREIDGEGIIAKHSASMWNAGTRTKQWLKWKNMKKGSFILTAYDEDNGFFHVAAIDSEGKIRHAGLFSNGLSSHERDALIQTVKNNASSKEGNTLFIEPFLCVELEYLELYKHQLRQPRFSRFLLNMHWEDCTWENVQKNNTSSM